MTTSINNQNYPMMAQGLQQSELDCMDGMGLENMGLYHQESYGGPNDFNRWRQCTS